MTLRRIGIKNRKTFLSRSPMPPRKQRMRKVNPENIAKKRKRKPRLKVAVRRAVLERDGHQCTHTNEVRTTLDWGEVSVRTFRCPEIDELQVHEKKYGTDNPDDCVTLCKAHHHALEAQIRPWNRGRLGRP